jgi:hypothetical protein
VRIPEKSAHGTRIHKANGPLTRLIGAFYRW